MAWQWTARAVDEMALLKPQALAWLWTIGTVLASCSTLRTAPSPSDPVNVCLPGYVAGENMAIESWGGDRVGRISRKKRQNKQEERAWTWLHTGLSEQHGLLNKSVFGKPILLIRFPSQLYFEENFIEQFWHYQEPLDFLDFHVRKEEEGMLHQVIFHPTKIFE